MMAAVASRSSTRLNEPANRRFVDAHGCVSTPQRISAVHSAGQVSEISMTRVEMTPHGEAERSRRAAQERPAGWRQTAATGPTSAQLAGREAALAPSWGALSTLAASSLSCLLAEPHL